MSDLIRRLRNPERISGSSSILGEAADEIERLNLVIEQRNALIIQLSQGLQQNYIPAQPYQRGS